MEGSEGQPGAERWESSRIDQRKNTETKDDWEKDNPYHFLPIPCPQRGLPKYMVKELVFGIFFKMWVWISFLSVALQGDSCCLSKWENIQEVMSALFLCWYITSFIFKDTVECTHVAQQKINPFAVPANRGRPIELFLVIQLPYIFPAHWMFCETSI